ncbi:site-2 protease family protein [Maribius pontilimi]|uniref:Zinc metalloprotease n=1 Tax=Palleronia pontilimi TaxID=1964209 RepID=A0A934IIK2_9RHOB|nr:site-2 protease family protein [Palleronia pontilimi]MBJ3763692.1 site-2 protease family protein [Palleronia pontilimi]
MWGSGIRIARLRGFDIRIDASWLLIAALIVWSLSTAYFPAQMPGAAPATLIVVATVAMLGLFASLILHEMAHATVAEHFGLRISGITLFVFGGIAELRSEPTSGASEFWIAIAGPIASLALALAFWFSAQVVALGGGWPTVQLVLGYLAWINMVLALFNLLPAFPMDGGRVLRAWLWARSGDLLGATRRAVGISAGFAYALMALGLFTVFSGAIAAGLWPILIGLFLLATSRATLGRLEAQAALDGRTVADLMTPHPWTTTPDRTLSELVEKVVLEHGASFVPVVEHGVLLGYVDLQIVRKIGREHWAHTTVDDVIESAAPDNTVAPEMDGLELLQKITRTGRRKFLVARGTRLQGVITVTDLMAYLSAFRQVSP